MQARRPRNCFIISIHGTIAQLCKLSEKTQDFDECTKSDDIM